MTSTLQPTNLLPPVPKRAPPTLLWDLPLIIKKDAKEELARYLEKKPNRLEERDAQGKTLLMHLIEEKATSCISFVIEKTSTQTIDTKDNQQRTALHYLCKRDFPVLVEQLLAAGADPREVDENGWSALHYAVAHNNIAVVQALKKIPKDALLDRYYSRVFQPNSQTPLHLAAGMPPNVLQEVLSFTKQIDNQNAKGRTALHLAVMGQFASANVAVLLAAGVNPHISDEHGQTPLSLACQLEKPEVVNLLLTGKNKFELGEIDSESLVQAFFNDDIKLTKYLLKHHFNPNAMWGQYKLLDIVSALGDKPFEEALIDAKATPTEFSRAMTSRPSTSKTFFSKITSSASPLHILSKKEDVGEHNGSLHERVLQKDLDIQVSEIQEHDWKARNPFGETPFLLCCRKGPLLNCAQLLKIRAIDFTAKDSEGNTAFHIALNRGDLLLLALLIGRLPKSLLNMPNSKGETVLHAAIQMGLRPFIEILLKCGLDPNIANQKGNTALHLLSHAPFVNSRDFAPIMALIMKKKGQLDAQNKAHQTPLEYAVSRHNDVVVDCLLYAGANPDVVDENGTSILIKACELNLYDTARKLVMFGAKRDLKGQKTPLIAACNTGNSALVQLFLDRKVPTLRKLAKRANPNHGPKTETPLTATIKKIAVLERNTPAAEREHNPLLKQAYDILQLLLRNKARPNKSIQIAKKERTTPLLLATQEKLERVLTILLEFGADPNRKPANRKCHRPLKVACRNGDVAIAKILLQNGATVKESLRSDQKLSKHIRHLLNDVSVHKTNQPPGVSLLKNSNSLLNLSKALKKERSGRQPHLNEEYVISISDSDTSVTVSKSQKGKEPVQPLAIDEDEDSNADASESDSYVSQASAPSDASSVSDEEDEEIFAIIKELEKFTMLKARLSGSVVN